MSDRPGRRHLLMDYGQVISLPQPEDEVAALAELTGLSRPEFDRRYWSHREAYDEGQPAIDYWTAVLGEAPSAALLDRLVEADMASWLHLDPPVLHLLDALRGTGWSVSLLSNAPHELGDVVGRLTELGGFEHLLFSADLGVIKPERRSYELAAERLGVAPGEIVFIDDREVNVAGAAVVGLEAIRWTGDHAPLQELLREGPR